MDPRKALLAASVVMVACSTPEAPTLTPEKVRVVDTSPAGLHLEVTLNAHNPNSISLSARSIKARVVLDGTTDLGEVTVPQGVKLPAKKTVQIVTPVQVKWANALAVGILAASKPVIPYTVKGTATVGAEGYEIDVPFALSSTMTREELLKATAGGVPTLPF